MFSAVTVLLREMAKCLMVHGGDGKDDKQKLKRDKETGKMVKTGVVRKDTVASVEEGDIGSKVRDLAIGAGKAGQNRCASSMS